MRRHFRLKLINLILDRYPKNDLISVLVTPLNRVSSHFNNIDIIPSIRLNNVFNCNIVADVRRLLSRHVLHNKTNSNTARVLVNRNSKTISRITRNINRINIVLNGRLLVNSNTILNGKSLARRVPPRQINTRRLHRLINMRRVTLKLTRLILTNRRPKITRRLFKRKFARHRRSSKPMSNIRTSGILTSSIRINKPGFDVRLKKTIKIVTATNSMVERNIRPRVRRIINVGIRKSAPLRTKTKRTRIVRSKLWRIISRLITTTSKDRRIKIILMMLRRFVLVLKRFRRVHLLLNIRTITTTIKALTIRRLAKDMRALTKRTMFTLMTTLMGVSLIVRLTRGLLSSLRIILVNNTSRTIMNRIRTIPRLLSSDNNIIRVNLKNRTHNNNVFFGLLTILIKTNRGPRIGTRRTLMTNGRIHRRGIVSITRIKLTTNMNSNNNSMGDQFFRGVAPPLTICGDLFWRLLPRGAALFTGVTLFFIL